MIIRAIHPSTDGNQKTNTTEKANSGQAILTVQNTTGFNVDDLLFIGEPKQELTEIAKISSISGKEITLSTNLTNTHSQNTRITVSNYDQVQFYKASSKTGTYSLVKTKDIAIDEPFTTYNDTTALFTDYYKIKYYNSATLIVSSFSDPIGITGFSRYSLSKIQNALFRKFGDAKEQFLTRDEITEWVNEIKDDMVNQIIDSNEKYFDDKVSLAVDSNGEASLPDNFRKFQQIMVLYDGVNGQRATKIELENIDDYSDSYSQTYPVYYFKKYTIGVRPKGTVGTTTISVKYESQPNDLENDSDEIPKPIRFYMNIIMDGLMTKACDKAGKDSRADRYELKYEKGIIKMIEEINNLVLDENREVQEQ